MTRTLSADVIRVLRQVFTRMGLPFVLTTDNAKNFSSQELKDYCVDYGIKLTHTTPYWPCANGEVERQNRSLLKVLKISQQRSTNLEEALQEYLYMYSVTPHSVTGVPPATLMFGRRFRDLFPHVQDEVTFDDEMRDKDATVKYRAKEYRDKRVGAKETSVNVGSEVLMKNMQPTNKLSPTFLPVPATVVEKTGSMATVQTNTGQQFKRNTSHLKVYHPPTPKTADSLEVTNRKEPIEGTEPMIEHQDRPRRSVSVPKRFDDYCLK